MNKNTTNIKIISWNCNSATVRIEHIYNILTQYNPDVLMLQETRTKSISRIDQYNIYHNPAINGRNGVAIISPHQLDVINTDNDGRLIHCKFQELDIVCVYVPNGGSALSSVEYKLDFFKTLSSLYNYENIVIGGDFNVLYKKNEYTIPHPYTLPEQETLMHLEEHLEYKTLHTPYITWWDYRNNGFRKNEGYGIDKIYTSKKLTPRTLPIQILYDFRKREKPSDHAPIYTEILKP